MIKWPDIKYGDPTPEGKAMDDSWNSCRAACIEAEKSGRMSVSEITQICGRVYCMPAHSKKEVDSRLLLDIVDGIYTALYGDTKPDERKEV